MRSNRPTIRRGPASYYAGADSVIREFSDRQSGGLLAVTRTAPDAPLFVDVYNAGADVAVRTDSRVMARDEPATAVLAKVRDALDAAYSTGPDEPDEGYYLAHVIRALSADLPGTPDTPEGIRARGTH